MSTEKSREKRIRRALEKEGYSLHKSRRKEDIGPYSGYMVVDIRGNYVVCGPNFDWSLDDVEEWLQE